MASDQDDPKYVNITSSGDLTDVSDAARSDGDNLRWHAADGEFKRVASAAAIADATDAATTQTRVNLVLAALRTHGIVAP